MERAQKVEAVEAYKGMFAGAGSVVVTHYSGLTVADMTSLRAKLREQGGQLTVVKNRLAKIALQGSSAEGASDMFTGPVAVAYAEDPVAAPKAAAEFAKSNEKLVLLGGWMDETVLDEAQIKALATMPSLDELRGKLVGLIQAPASKVARVVQAPAGQIARVLQAYADKEQA